MNQCLLLHIGTVEPDNDNNPRAFRVPWDNPRVLVFVDHNIINNNKTSELNSSKNLYQNHFYKPRGKRPLSLGQRY